MGADFTGRTAELYAQYRRDLPGDQTARLAVALGLRSDDIVVDIGCGTGQLAAPISEHCRAVIAVDPEPAMLVGLHARRVPGVLPVLGADTDLPGIAALLGDTVGAVVAGNALHWMSLSSVARSARAMLRPGSGLAVVTQGPPLWLGDHRWQQQVRSVLEGRFGPVRATCGSDEVALADRVEQLRRDGWRVEVLRSQAAHLVEAEWVIGHLGSALPADALDAVALRDLREVLDTVPAAELVEVVTTTVVVAH